MSSSLKLSVQEISDWYPHSLPKAELFELLQTSKTGLSEAEVSKRRQIFSWNKLIEFKPISTWKIFFNQFASLLVAILLIAALFSLAIGETFDTAAILAIIFINALLGFVQEYKAEKAIEDLKKLETLHCQVIREGKVRLIASEELVPGDLIVLTEGEKIPADARILTSTNLQVDESLLTGEAETVNKKDKILAKQTILPEQTNMLFAGCNVVAGKTTALVVSTGMNTQLGLIATDLGQINKTLTPLQKVLDKLAKTLAIISIALSLPGLLAGLLLGRDPLEMLMLAISLAVSSIPESLPIVVTVALALGIKRMIKKKVLVRRLASVETLGGVDVICTDKTGTITHHKMTVVELFLPQAGFFKVAEQDFPTGGTITANLKLNQQYQLNLPSSETKTKVNTFCQNLILSSDATLELGDPTEKALVTLARKVGFDEEKLRQQFMRLAEIPFNSEKKFMAVMIRGEKYHQALIKGAPETVLALCKLSQKQWSLYDKINDDLTSQGLRVLALAGKKVERQAQMKKLADYQFLGLVAMYDPPRKEVKAALKLCKQAGIRVMMLTGDHRRTAQSIAEEIGLKSQQAVTGYELDQLSASALDQVVSQVNIFARVLPRHKVAILNSLQKHGLQVAMTGDGVNDAPALKKADVGVAVGSGTDLTKEVADLILLDDSFANIVEAVKEGRTIFFNLKKFVRFLLTANFDEILGILSCILLRIPLFLLPIQILWINLVTDSFPALALTNDVADKDLMKHPPYQANKEILNQVINFAFFTGIVGYIFTFGLFLFSLYVLKKPLIEARTICFTATVLFEFFLVFIIRSDRQSAFKVGLFSNYWICLAVLVGILAQLWAIYHPLAQRIFKTTALNLQDWLTILLTIFTGAVIIELWKFLKVKLEKH